MLSTLNSVHRLWCVPSPSRDSRSASVRQGGNDLASDIGDAFQTVEGKLVLVAAQQGKFALDLGNFPQFFQRQLLSSWVSLASGRSQNQTDTRPLAGCRTAAEQQNARQGRLSLPPYSGRGPQPPFREPRCLPRSTAPRKPLPRIVVLPVIAFEIRNPVVPRIKTLHRYKVAVCIDKREFAGHFAASAARIAALPTASSSW